MDFTQEADTVAETDLSGACRALGAFLCTVSMGAVACAWGAQVLLHLRPCELCLLERVPWYALACLGTILLLFPKRAWLRGCCAGLAVLALGVELVLNVVHWGVERKWWPSPFAACRGDVGGSGLMSALPARPLKPCDVPDYVLGLPLSLSHLSGLYTIAVFVAFCVLWYALACRRFR